MIVAQAPGRLDVMGGIADYSGSLVLELPLDRTTRVSLEPQDAPRLDVVTRREGRSDSFSMDLDAPVPRDPPWAPYVAGVVQYCRQRAATNAPGLRLTIESTVPEGKGVASSAALEVACMMAVAAHWNLAMTPAEIATACQWVENHVVGAPCGIMDQMTSACGEEGRLLRLRCQPATIEGQIEIPAGLRFYGIDSGIRHAVTGADYATVRAAAFAGRAIIARVTGKGDYLANIAPAEYTSRFESLLPAALRAATAHPIFENDRVERFAALLGATTRVAPTEAITVGAALVAAREMGQLMYESHESYGACGLGSDGTDRLVALVREAGPGRGLFGARITGGGSGGTVAILGTDTAEPVVREIASRYAAETGRRIEVFTGSGPGAGIRFL